MSDDLAVAGLGEVFQNCVFGEGKHADVNVSENAAEKQDQGAKDDGFVVSLELERKILRRRRMERRFCGDPRRHNALSPESSEMLEGVLCKTLKISPYCF